MKVVSSAGLTKLIQLIKATFIPKTDVEAVSELTVDSTPASGSSNLITSGGVYTGLSGKAASVHTHAKSQITDFPTNVSAFTNDAGYLTQHQSLEAYRTSAEQDVIDNALDGRLDTLESYVPSETTASNKLADKAFVNSSISTNTATFRGTSVAGLTEEQFLAWANGLTKTNNDYVFWNTTDTDGNVLFKRYKYNGTNWVYEYSLNNSSFTASQWAAINSGVTSSVVSSIAGKEDASNKVTSLSSSSTDTQYPSAKCTYAGLATKQNVIDSSHKLPAANVSGLATVATSGSYDDLSDKPFVAGRLIVQLFEGGATASASEIYSAYNDGAYITCSSSGNLELVYTDQSKAIFGGVQRYDGKNLYRYVIIEAGSWHSIVTSDDEFLQPLIDANNKLASSLVSYSDTTVESALTNTSTQIANIGRKLDFLAKMVKGFIYDITTVISTFYQRTILSGEVCVAVNKYGGHTVVSSNQLVSADVAAIDSGGGKNKIDQSVFSSGSGIAYDGEYYYASGTTWFDNYTSGIPCDYQWLPNTRYTLSYTGKLSASGAIGVGIRYTDNATDFAWSTTTEPTLVTVTSQANKTIQYIRISYSAGAENRLYIKNLQVEQGTSFSGYEPYFHEKLEIPSALRTAYPLKSAGTVYDEYDLQNKKFIQRVGSRAYQSGDENNSAYITDGTTTHYPLSSATEVDISSYIGDDNLLNVNSGGTLTFTQTNGTQLTIPNTCEYAVKLDEV